MKKVIIFIISLFFYLPVLALEEIEYKNIEEGAKVAEINSNWTQKVPKKHSNYFIKKVSTQDSKLSEFYSADGNIFFSTGCHYEVGPFETVVEGEFDILMDIIDTVPIPKL